MKQQLWGTIKVKIMRVCNPINEGKKMFFNVEDVCEMLYISKKDWEKLWNDYKVYILQPKIENFDYKIFYNENHYVEKISGMNEEWESLYCTTELLDDILPTEKMNSFLDIIGTL